VRERGPFVFVFRPEIRVVYLRWKNSDDDGEAVVFGVDW